MTGLVTIRAWTVPEAWLWAVGGAIGFLLGIPGAFLLVLLLMSNFDPNLALATFVCAAILGPATLLARRSGRPAVVRASAALVWWLGTAWSYVAIVTAWTILPLDRSAGIFNLLISLVAMVGEVIGSALLAALSFEVGRRWLARPTTDDPRPSHSAT